VKSVDEKCEMVKKIAGECNGYLISESIPKLSFTTSPIVTAYLRVK
jgi:hypothetical protein